MGKSRAAQALRFALVFVTLTATAAVAQPSKTVSYLYYSVSGKTAMEIYRAMLTHGPHAGDALAFATTASKTDQQAVIQSGHGCRFASYQLKMSFTTKLPQLSSTVALAAPDMARWQTFNGFVQRHEAGHRDIWMNCAAKLETDLLALKAPNCGDLARQAIKLAAASGARCGRLHAAYDAAQQRLLKQQPLIQAVMSQQAKN